MITEHNDFIQGDEAWLQARCGLLTASEMKLILTPTLKTADNHMECQQWFRELTADFRKRGSSLRPTRFEYRSN